MDRIIGWFLIGIVCVGVIFEWGYNVGMNYGENKVMVMQERSADALADKIVNKDCNKEILADLNTFTFDVCKGLGLIKGGSDE